MIGIIRLYCRLRGIIWLDLYAKTCRVWRFSPLRSLLPVGSLTTYGEEEKESRANGKQNGPYGRKRPLRVSKFRAHFDLRSVQGLLRLSLYTENC